MAQRFTFEQALAILEIDASAGPRNAKRALMLQLQRHGPEPSPEDYARFTGAYEVLKDPAIWPDYSPPEAWDDDLAPRPQRRLPPGHKRSSRERLSPPSAPPPPAQAGAPKSRPTQTQSNPVSGLREDPFAHLDSPQPEEPQAASTTQKTNALLENEAVMGALVRLENNYGATLPKEILLDHMSEDGTKSLTAFLNQLLDSGEFLATGATVAALLELMNSDDSLEFVDSRGVVRIMIGIFSQADIEPKAITVGSSIQRAYDRWATASELNPPSLDISTRDNLRITRSLAALPQEFPPELIAATAGAMKRGDLNGVRTEFSTWVEAYDEQAEGLKRILARSAPALLHVVADIFPDKSGPEAGAGFDFSRLKKLGLRFIGLACLLAVGWFALQDDAFESEERKALLEASRALCDYAGQEHAACSLSKLVLDALPDSNCAILEPLIPQFVSAVHSMKNNTAGMSSAVDLGALNAVKGEADKIVIAAQTKCASI